VNAARLVGPAIMVGYPLLVYGGLKVLQPRWVALVLGGALLAREIAGLRRGAASPLLLPIVLVGGVLGLALVFNEGRFFLFVPVLVNAALFVSFARTLRAGPSMVESLARQRFGHVPPEHVGYCRRVTEVWCAFFVVNSALILWLALGARIEYWALYTGLIAYVLVAALFTAEMTYRAWRFRRYEGDVTDVVFRRMFPPRPAR
jgi:uncharacterized membrane protein